MIWPESDFWNILYIIYKTSKDWTMKLYSTTQNILNIIYYKFHEIWTSSYKIMRL